MGDGRANPQRLSLTRNALNSDLVADADPDRFEVLIDQPSDPGADRLVNAVGAYIEHGGPLIVIDFGTATTFDVIDADGNYCGGVIAPAGALVRRGGDTEARENLRPEGEVLRPIDGPSPRRAAATPRRASSRRRISCASPRTGPTRSTGASATRWRGARWSHLPC